MPKKFLTIVFFVTLFGQDISTLALDLFWVYFVHLRYTGKKDSLSKLEGVSSFFSFFFFWVGGGSWFFVLFWIFFVWVGFAICLFAFCSIYRLRPSISSALMLIFLHSFMTVVFNNSGIFSSFCMFLVITLLPIMIRPIHSGNKCNSVSQVCKKSLFMLRSLLSMWPFHKYFFQFVLCKQLPLSACELHASYHCHILTLGSGRNSKVSALVYTLW